MNLILPQVRAKALLKLYEIEENERSNYDTLRAVYQKNPLDYIADRFGINRESIDWSLLLEYSDHRWDGTPNPLKTILDSLVTNNRIGVESATGTGKTFLGALIVFWFLENFENSIVVTTAPKQDQLTLHIWKEIGKLYNKFGKGHLTTLKLRMNEGRDDWVAVGFIAGIKADEESSTKAQGFHAEHMLIIMEETPGVPQPIMTAFLNTCTAPHNIILAFGNPDHQMDNLHKFCTTPGTKHIRISAFDHPNVVLDNANFIPGATSRAGLSDMLNRYGSSESPLYLSRARGISPGQSSDSLIQMQWCIDSRDGVKRSEKGIEQLNRDEMMNGDRALGVDVANSESGDKAAIAEGVGAVLIDLKDFQCPDANQLGKRDIYLRMKEKNIKPRMIGVDGIGVGAGTVNALKELGIRVSNIISSEKQVPLTGQTEIFDNLRSQMYWQLREDLRNGRLILCNDEELFADLVTPKWEVRNGKICVEKKEEIKKRLGHSPNKGDAVVYWNWVRTLRLNTKFEFGG